MLETLSSRKMLSLHPRSPRAHRRDWIMKLFTTCVAAMSTSSAQPTPTYTASSHRWAPPSRLPSASALSRERGPSSRPHPRIHFILTSYTPVISAEKAYHEQQALIFFEQASLRHHNQMIKEAQYSLFKFTNFVASYLPSSLSALVII